MKFIDQSYEIIDDYPAQKLDMGSHIYVNHVLDYIFKQIELAGRVSHKSEDVITEESAQKFVSNLIQMNHGAALEFGTVYLTIPFYRTKDDLDKLKIEQFFHDNPYSKIVHSIDSKVFVTTNFRVLAENKSVTPAKKGLLLLDDVVEFITPPTQYHPLRTTVKFITCRQVSHEFVRHRKFSFLQESTRFCNYSKGKYGNELTFINPCWINDMEDKRLLTNQLSCVEADYMRMINKGWKAQQAASILPNILKTELFMCGFIEDWEHFFDLRYKGTTGAPHPLVLELTTPLYKEFKEKGLIYDNEG